MIPTTVLINLTKKYVMQKYMEDLGLVPKEVIHDQYKVIAFHREENPAAISSILKIRTILPIIKAKHPYRQLHMLLAAVISIGEATIVAVATTIAKSDLKTCPYYRSIMCN